MGPSVSFPLPPRIVQKLPIRSCWELLVGKLPIPLPMFYYFELIREVLANTLYKSLLPWWTSRIFSIFFCSGRRKGESEAPGGGGGSRFLIENPRRGGLQEGRGGGAGRVSAANFWELGGGGAKYFFFGAEMSTKLLFGWQFELHRESAIWTGKAPSGRHTAR